MPNPNDAKSETAPRMTVQEIETWLQGTLEDRRFSRNERQSLGGLLASLGPDADREAIRRQAFTIAASAIAQPDDRKVLTWLEDVLKALRETQPSAGTRSIAEAYYSPGDDCYLAIKRQLGHARDSVAICVFTITDDRLADSILEAHSRGIAVRIITDNAKAEDLGSDVDRFERAGIPLRMDQSPFHMHHKFAILDSKTLLNGSYNWTRGAAHDNEENLIVIDDPRLVTSFAKTFERLWVKLAKD
jgi:cardiolipin hydrolase